MSISTELLFERYYYSQPDYCEGTVEFHAMCADAVLPNGRILEIGAGPPNRTSRFLARLGAVEGLDVSDELRGNDALAAAHVYDGTHFPFPDGSFHTCVSDYVLEHVADGRAHFREVARVLRPGGRYVFRTPNAWHYVCIGARLIPHRLHGMANWLRSLPSDAHDPWPTFYRCNTARRLRALCRDAGLVIEAMQAVEKEPAYGRAHPLLFFPMMAYERLVNSSDLYRWVRANIHASVMKPDENTR